jgi:hypothetical protein
VLAARKDRYDKGVESVIVEDIRRVVFRWWKTASCTATA